MKQRVLERARSTVGGVLHRQCADTTLGVLSVNPEVDDYGDALLIRFTYDDKGLPDSLAQIKLLDRLVACGPNSKRRMSRRRRSSRSSPNLEDGKEPE